MHVCFKDNGHHMSYYQKQVKYGDEERMDPIDVNSATNIFRQLWPSIQMQMCVVV